MGRKIGEYAVQNYLRPLKQCVRVVRLPNICEFPIDAL